MTAKEIEIAAYTAAHQILDADTVATQFASPGARRSHAVDTIADIIRDVFELHTLSPASSRIGHILRLAPDRSS